MQEATLNAAKAEIELSKAENAENAENKVYNNSSNKPMGNDEDGKPSGHGWEILDRKTGKSLFKINENEKDAANKAKSYSYDTTVTVRRFHTGLKNGLIEDKDNNNNFSVIEKYPHSQCP